MNSSIKTNTLIARLKPKCNQRNANVIFHTFWSLYSFSAAVFVDDPRSAHSICLWLSHLEIRVQCEWGLSLASQSYTDPEKPSGTSSGKDPLQNHNSLRCELMPVGKQRMTAWPQVRSLRAHNKGRGPAAANQTNSSGSLVSPDSIIFLWEIICMPHCRWGKTSNSEKAVSQQQAKSLFSMKCLRASQVRWRGTPCPAFDFVDHLLRGSVHFILWLKTHSDLGYCKYVTPSWGLKVYDDVFTTCHRTRFGSNLSCLLLRARPPDTAWAETEAFDYSRLADRSSYPSLRRQLVFIKSAQARQRFFPASGSNDLLLSNPHLPGPHRCADKV